jgi:hypothetical protein
MAFTVYTDTADNVRTTWTSSIESWTDSLQRIKVQAPNVQLRGVDLRRAVEEYFDDSQRIFEINRDCLRNLAGVLLSGGEVALDYSKSMSDVLRRQAGMTVEMVREQADRLQDSQRAQAPAAQRTEQPAPAVDRYRELTKAELSERLNDRNMPRTGTIEELRQRLIEADLEAAVSAPSAG